MSIVIYKASYWDCTRLYHEQDKTSRLTNLKFTTEKLNISYNAIIVIFLANLACVGSVGT